MGGHSSFEEPFILLCIRGHTERAQSEEDNFRSLEILQETDERNLVGNRCNYRFRAHEDPHYLFRIA